jgi:hypothetical protein
VFRNVEGCLIAEDLSQRHRDHREEEWHRSVVVGCDVAKHTDWTVLIAMDAESGRCFAMERFNQLDWPIQKERIVEFARKYRGRVILDATGVGDPILDDLKRVLPDIEGYKLTAGSKVELIQRLVVAIEQRRVSWPGGRVSHGGTKGTEGRDFEPQMDADGRGWEILTNELKRYEYQIGPSGQISYGAPAGFHDDCVIALALANHGRWEGETCGRMWRVGGGRSLSQSRRGRRERVVCG